MRINSPPLKRVVAQICEKRPMQTRVRKCKITAHTQKKAKRTQREERKRRRRRGEVFDSVYRCCYYGHSSTSQRWKRSFCSMNWTTALQWMYAIQSQGDKFTFLSLVALHDKHQNSECCTVVVFIFVIVPSDLRTFGQLKT